MTKLYHAVIAVAALAAFSLGAGSAAEAGCFYKAASGTNTTLEGAKFQAHEAILQSFDWSLWATWMATGTTPGYRISPKYSCSKGGLGYNCHASASICKS